MLYINNNTKMNFLFEALPLDAVTRMNKIIIDAIEIANEDWPNSWTLEKIGDLTIKEFENFLVDLKNFRLKKLKFDYILKNNAFRETIIISP